MVLADLIILAQAERPVLIAPVFQIMAVYKIVIVAWVKAAEPVAVSLQVNVVCQETVRSTLPVVILFVRH
jgi:hypothetical protein